MALTRFLFILLAVLNLLVFAAIQGWLGSAPPRGEPERVANQLHPERLRFMNSAPPEPPPTTPTGESAPATAPAMPTAISPNAETAQSPAATTPPAICLAWHGLGNDDANRLAERLQAAGAEVRRSSIDAPNAWWVRLPPQGGREQAERKLKELKALGVTDYFIVQDPGPNQFAISLGLFKSEAAANQQLAQLRAKGVRTAGIAPRMSAQQRIEAVAAADRLASFRAEAGPTDAHQADCQP